MTRETIDQLARRLFESMPQSVKSVREDVEKNFRSVLSSGLSRMDLVTREEFEVQQAVLARTRAKLEALEGRLGALEDLPGVTFHIYDAGHAFANTHKSEEQGHSPGSTERAHARSFDFLETLR